MRTGYDEISYINHKPLCAHYYMNYAIFLIVSLCVVLSSCSLKPVSKTKNVTYSVSNNLQLDVYAPRKMKEPKKVLLFVHGGNWVHGKKSIYRFYGKGMARKGVIGVVMNYRLSPKTNYEGMANDVATAVKWVKDNSASFGGDTNNIYISGHSAGAQLAGLVAYDNSYFKKPGIQNPIKGVVLIDGFGLDMYRYFTVSDNPKDTMYKRVFSNDPVTWKKASPAWHLDKHSPPTLMFVGGRTYPVIKQVNEEFYTQLKTVQLNAQLIKVKGKSHAPMIFQFINPRAKAYRHILDFMEVKGVK